MPKIIPGIAAKRTYYIITLCVNYVILFAEGIMHRAVNEPIFVLLKKPRLKEAKSNVRASK